MRQVSAKRRRQEPVRRALRAEVIERQGGMCARCLRPRPLDVHERVRRSQLTDAHITRDVVVGLCRQCHDWVTLNPTAAHAEGWVIWSWEYRQGRR